MNSGVNISTINSLVRMGKSVQELIRLEKSDVNLEDLKENLNKKLLNYKTRTYVFKDELTYTSSLPKPYLVVLPVTYKEGVYMYKNHIIGQNKFADDMTKTFSNYESLSLDWFKNYFIPKNGEITVTFDEDVDYFMIAVMEPYYTSIYPSILSKVPVTEKIPPVPDVHTLKNSQIPHTKGFIIKGSWTYRLWFTRVYAKVMRSVEI